VKVCGAEVDGSPVQNLCQELAREFGVLSALPGMFTCIIPGDPVIVEYIVVSPRLVWWDSVMFFRGKLGFGKGDRTAEPWAFPERGERCTFNVERSSSNLAQRGLRGNRSNSPARWERRGLITGLSVAEGFAKRAEVAAARLNSPKSEAATPVGVGDWQGF
jgi:hypothetical protein